MAESKMGGAAPVDLTAIRTRRATASRGAWGLDRAPTDGPGHLFELRVNDGGRVSVIARLRRDDAVFLSSAAADVDALLALVEVQQRALLMAAPFINEVADRTQPTAFPERRPYPWWPQVAEAIEAALVAAGEPDRVARDLKRAERSPGGT